VSETVAEYLSTGALARAASVGRETLRFYEEQGLIAPVARTRAGYRQFAMDVVAVIGFIKQCQRAGFSIKEIRHLLQLRANGQDTCGSISELLEHKLKQVDATLLALREQRGTLDQLVQTCAGHDPARLCGFVQEKSGCC
jgi:MerR family transcriptional regulator, copper efflux regulator